MAGVGVHALEAPVGLGPLALLIWLLRGILQVTRSIPYERFEGFQILSQLSNTSYIMR